MLSHVRLLQPHGLQPARLLCPWDSPGKNTGVGGHFLLQGIFPAQGLNSSLLHCRQILHRLSHQGSPKETDVISISSEGLESLQKHCLSNILPFLPATSSLSLITRILRKLPSPIQQIFLIFFLLLLCLLLCNRSVVSDS